MQWMFTAEMNPMHSILVMIFSNLHPRPKICGFDIMYMAREHVIPAQVHRVSRNLGNIFDQNHHEIYKLDIILSKTPLSLFSKDYMLISKKQ